MGIWEDSLFLCPPVSGLLYSAENRHRHLKPSNVLLQLAFLCDYLVEPDVKQRPCKHVDNENHRVVEEMDGHHREGAEACRHNLDAYHRAPRRESHGQELVVDVRFVGHEQRLVVAGAPEHHTDNVQAGHHQYAERHKHRAAHGHDAHGGVVHAVFDYEEAQDEAQRQAARISHEDFPPPVDASEHVVGKEGDDDTHAYKGKQGERPVAEVDEQDAEHDQRDHAQSRSQSVDSVDQVDGVGDEHHQQDGERDADGRIYLIDAEKAVEAVDIQSGQREHGSCENLHEEFLAVAHAHQVVAYAHDVEQCKPPYHEEELAGDPPDLSCVGVKPDHDAYGREHGEGEEDDRKECDAAQPWHRPLVDLS